MHENTVPSDWNFIPHVSSASETSWKEEAPVELHLPKPACFDKV